jgi:O-antigen ligase
MMRKTHRLNMSEIDKWWTGYLVSVPGLAGSLVSFLYYGAGIWALVSVVFRRFPINLPRRSRLFVVSCVGYALALLVASVANDGLRGIGPGLLAGAAFYFVPFIVSRYRYSAPEQSFEFMCRYAPAGSILCFLSALFQVVLARPVEGGAGNASVLGFVSVVLGCISLANGHSNNQVQRFWAYAGFAAGVGALMMSRTRVLYPLIVIAPALFLTFASGSTKINRAKIAGVFLLIGLAVLIWFRQRIAGEFGGILAELNQNGMDSADASLGIRIELWKAAFASILESPWLGHGHIHKMEGVYSRLPDMISYLRFTHAHNIWIDNALAGGATAVIFLCLIIVSPLAMLTSGVRHQAFQNRNFIIIIMVIISALNGILNTLFTHDIMTTLYLVPLTLAAAFPDNQSSFDQE